MSDKQFTWGQLRAAIWEELRESEFVGDDDNRAYEVIGIVGAAVDRIKAPASPNAIPYQKCPKCDGQGTVSKPPYVPGDVHEWSSTSAAHVCDVCGGSKVIAMGVPGSGSVGAVWVKASIQLPSVTGKERMFVKYDNGNIICNLVCLYDSGRFHSAEWGILPNERVEYLDETGNYKSSYVQEYKQMKEYQKFLGGPTEWTKEKIKTMNRIEILEALRGYQELIQFLDNTIYAIEEGCAQWEERAKQAERTSRAQSGKEEFEKDLWRKLFYKLNELGYTDFTEDDFDTLQDLVCPEFSLTGLGKEEKAFAEWLEENTEIIRGNPKITLYRYCDKNNQWGNYTLDDIYDEYKQNKQS